MKKIFITRDLPGNIDKFLKKKGFDVKVYKGKSPIAKKELIRHGADCDALICLLTEKIDREIIDSLPNCKIIANVAVGYNNIDVEYASGKKIIVTNTPDILTDATADLSMTLILSAARRVVEGEKMMRSLSFTGWDPNMLLGIELKDKFLGIIGAGRIGKAVAERGKAFGMKILYSDSKRVPFMEEKMGGKKLPLKALLKKADVITLHVPLNEKTRHMLNNKNLPLLKKSTILVNTSRGEIIEEKYLINMLKKKKLFAAGLDVYENEPEINPELVKLENVVILPHIGSATLETRSRMALLAAENASLVLKGKSPKTPVNRIF